MWKRIQHNWKSGLTVALVSIPLSVSLAVASGANPVQGIITAVWAGLVASLVGGSNYNIVGPAGALSGILAAYALAHGFAMLPMVAIVAGIFVLIAWVAKLERYLVFVPGSAVHGFTLGVAVLIAFGQVNSALGISGLVAHEHFLDNLMETIRHLNGVSNGTVIVFGLFLVGLFVIAKYLPKVPAVLALASVGIILGYVTSVGILGLNLVTLGSKFPSFRGELIGKFVLSYDPKLVLTALTVAIVAILETMLSAKIADGMTGTKYNRRREMLGLGLANIASGLVGGLPATAVLARTAVNIKSGANHKISATISSVAIAVVSLLFLSYFKFIPMAVIAAILCFAAVRMVEIKHFKKMWELDRKGFWLALLVAGVTVVEDPSMAILVGIVMSLLILVEKMSRGQFEVMLNRSGKLVHRQAGEELEEIKQGGDTLVYSIKGQLLHLSAHSHLARFDKDLNGYKNIVLRLRELQFLDLEGVECISEIIEKVKTEGRRLAITGVNDFIQDMLGESKQFLALEKEGLVFEKTSQALKRFGSKTG